MRNLTKYNEDLSIPRKKDVDGCSTATNLENGTGSGALKQKGAVAASGANTTAFGSGTSASASNAHAEGNGTVASGNASHAQITLRKPLVTILTRKVPPLKLLDRLHTLKELARLRRTVPST